jgi:dihydrofolate synthase/folylpolyglutamate synthase
MDSSDALIARFLALHPKTIDLSLGRIQRLLGRLGHPERRLPPAIHVAGTNGKGSTIAFMRAILESAGLAVHVYTSPHLVRFHERIRLGQFGGGRYVTEERLVGALRRCEAVNGASPSRCSRSPPRRRSSSSPRSPPTFSCSKWGSAGGSTPPK